MTSPRLIGSLVVGALTLGLLAGCDLGHPGGFTARSNSYCAQTATAVGKLTTPTDPKEQMQFATDRYTLIEKLVSEMTDSALPSGANGTQLRDHWLRPARASLTGGRTALADLRAAVNGTAANRVQQADSAFEPTLAIGTQGVDTTLLSQQGLTDCARVFQPTKL